MIENTWAEGLNPKSNAMSDEQAKLFLSATIAGLSDSEIPEVNQQFLIQILNKRMEVHKLPIHFTDSAKMAILALVDRPGSVVALLIDCLNKYEGQTVTTSMLASLYPMGFYDEETLMKYIDEYLKPKKVKWAELY